MSRELVSKQIKVNPGVRGSTDCATENVFVEVAGNSQVSNSKSQMKRSNIHGLVQEKASQLGTET